MGATNAQGIYVYDATDQVSPLHTLLNLQATAVTNRLGQIFTVCTSTTRPVSPYPNQWIRETDTGSIGFWDGSNWIRMPYRTGGTSQYAPNVTGNQTANVDLNNYALPSATFPRMVTANSAVQGTLTNTGRARLLLGYDSGTPTANGTQAGTSLAVDYVQGNGTSTAETGLTCVATGINVAAGATLTYKSMLQMVAGTFNVSDTYGANFWLTWVEAGGNL